MRNILVLFKNYKVFLILALILTLAALFRFYGQNWDQNQHLHPDERFLTMVEGGISLPQSFTEYFSTSTSPLNPYNKGFGFYVYGTFPLFLVKVIGEILGKGDYDQVILVGRAVSTVVDLLTILVVFLIGQKFSKRVGLLSAFLYSISVLPIQLAHFFAVDTFLNFFMILSFYFLISNLSKPRWWLIGLAGISLGLAAASKVTAILLLPVIIIIFTKLLFKHFSKTVLLALFFGLFAFFSFRVFQPYAFSGESIFDLKPNPQFIANIKELQNQGQPGSYFPPAVSWNHTQPIVYSLKYLITLGLGVPLGILVLTSIIFTSSYFLLRIIEEKKIDHQQIITLCLLVLFFTIFIYQGIQFSKPLRYLLPIFPSISILTAIGLVNFKNITDKLLKIKLSHTLFIFIILITFIWPLSFMAIYSQPHSRVSASEWIYQNLPPGTTVSYEYWDDPLPLNLPNHPSSGIYLSEQLALYNEENPQKWLEVKSSLEKVDYLILSSNRLYGSITRASDMYPQTSKFYEALFDGRLGFEKVAQFTSRPNLPIPFIQTCLILPGSDYGVVALQLDSCDKSGISFVDDYGDESFTVYDHPKVLIFKKNYNIPPADLFNLLEI